MKNSWTYCALVGNGDKMVRGSRVEPGWNRSLWWATMWGKSIRGLLGCALLLVAVAGLGCNTDLLTSDGSQGTTASGQDPAAGNPLPEPAPTPAIVSLLPDVGPMGGGTRVTVRGVALGTSPAVLFDGVAGLNIERINGRLLTVETPAHEPGLVDVRIVGEDGVDITMESAFEYRAPATPAELMVTVVRPSTGPISGGTRVTIEGMGFPQGAVVRFDDQVATDIEVRSEKLILAVSPAHRVGAANVAVVAPDGRSDTLAGIFDYQPLPITFPPADTTAPRLVSAISIGNTQVRVTFNEPMGPIAADPQSYAIGQENVNPEAGTLTITAASFDTDGFSVVLTTLPQNEVLYTLKVSNVHDQAGNVIAAPERFVDPTTAMFFGTPLSGPPIDSDGDGLPDSEEQRGWVVTVVEGSGSVITREVTSDPLLADTDSDGLSDFTERAMRTDPRDVDTDSDSLDDQQERSEIRSSAVKQDSDDDGLSDGLEFTLFHTSPLLVDTDGDQIDDEDEIILANRNPRVADLPLPGIEIGDVDLQLDVRFTATSSQGSRELETQNVTSTLTQSESKKFSNTDSNTHSTFAKIGVSSSYKVELVKPEWETTVSAEAGYSGQWTSSFTRESSKSTQRAVAKSFTTQEEVTQNESVSRQVTGAVMNVSVNLKSIGSIAFTIENVQITALVQDPRDPTRLIPVATLLPASGVPNSFNLGPLSPTRGPFIFSNDQIFPALVQDLMLDPRGLIFKVANFDILDEFGRNFAFTSQAINDRTAPLVIDFGGADTDGDGEGDTTERFRVATSGGRAIEDTNGDGVIDELDRRVVFDPEGNPVGIPLREGLRGVIGLTQLDEDDTPTSSLSQLEIDSSYSTRMMAVDTNGDNLIDDNDELVETLWRVRGVSSELTNPLKRWEVLSPTGIDRRVGFGDRRLSPENGIVLAFVQDLDNDGLPARWEFIQGCSDSPADVDGDGVADGVDTDSDGLDDRFEVYEGWEVDVLGKGTLRTYASCARSDSDLDGLTDDEEFERFVDVDTTGDGMPDTSVRQSTDPRNPDTDDDLVSDFDEINGYTVELRFPCEMSETMGVCGRIDTDRDGTLDTDTVFVTTNPLSRDTDGDTLADGAEITLGLDPTVDDGEKVFDDDGDGLVNFEETVVGWDVVYHQVGTTELVQGPAVQLHVNSLPTKVDTDDDLIDDRQERDLATNPNEADTDGDGLPDVEEVEAIVVDGQASFAVLIDPLDADTDDDLRSDGDEVNVSWTVQLFGSGEITEVFSDPLEADADNDGLVDSRELTAGTDPRDADTDDDNRTDLVEVNVGTNPLRPDQRITFRYTNINIIADCDPGNSGGEFEGLLKLRRPDGVEVTVFDINGNCDSTPEGGTCSVNRSRSFILNEGQNFVAFSTNVQEDDSTSGDEQLGSFTQDFNYPQTGGNVSWTLQESSGCEIRINAIITVQ